MANHGSLESTLPPPVKPVSPGVGKETAGAHWLERSATSAPMLTPAADAVAVRVPVAAGVFRTSSVATTLMSHAGSFVTTSKRSVMPPGAVIELAANELNSPTRRAQPVVVVTEGATTFVLDAFA